MHPFFAAGGISPGQKRFEKKLPPISAAPSTPASSPLEASETTTPIAIGKSHSTTSPFSQSQALALRMLTFGARTTHISPSVRLENDFLRTMKQTPSPAEKALLAEMLGRAGSINAVPHLIKLMDEKEDVEVRTSAAAALAHIGSSTNKNSFTTTELTDALLDTYQQRKGKMTERIANPASELCYEKKLQECETRQKLMDEIKTLVLGVSQLNVVRGRTALNEEYRKTLALTQMKETEVKEMIRATELAEEQFHKELEKRFQKPVKEILKSLPKKELEELQKKVMVKKPDGQTINLLEALQQITLLQEQQEQFASQLLLGLMEALSLHNDREANTSIKLALSSNHPDVKARSLEILSERNGLNYNTDVYPNLHSRDNIIRQAALQALLASPEQSAKQKTLELISPDAFFKVTGGLTRGSMAQYSNFLATIAEHGDDYVHALTKRALHADYDLETRQISLLVLGMMVTPPAVKGLSPETITQAATAIKVLALAAPVRSPQERDKLALTATQLWVQMGDVNAIPVAIQLADSKDHKLTGKDEERLLSSVLRVLQEDSKSKSKEKAESELQTRLLDVMKTSNNPLLSAEGEKEIRSGLREDKWLSRINPKDPEEFADENDGVDADARLVDQLQSELPELRPVLTRLAESDKSNLSQMMAFRILGLLEDKKSVKYLIDRVKNPIQSKLDWKSDISYNGDPAITGANLRLNALAALGDIGDAKALDVMLDAMEDPILKNQVLEPLGKLAKDANENASDTRLNKVRNKLRKVLETPNTSRAMRAVRINAANTLYKFKGGVDIIKDFATQSTDPNFRRHALSALLSNNHGVEEEHPDHGIVKDLIYPGLGVEKLHARGITGKGVELAIIDGGYVDHTNEEGFQDRVKLPAQADDPESSHPTMVMSTAAANGKLKGVAPDAVAYSDKWPDFSAKDPMEVYKKIIEGKLRGENNIRVINNSWGFSSQNAILHKDIREILKQYKNVVNLAEKAGIQIVFAAGNEGEEPGLPKLGTLSVFGMDVDKLTSEEKKDLNYVLDKVIMVGAINTQGSDKRANHRMAEFSSMGDHLNRRLSPTVVAPGADMMVYGWDKHKGNPKQLVNGTSFASPYVTGLLTLMYQANPKLSPAESREILKKTANKLTGVPVTQQGYGEVNPEAAVRMAENYHKSAATKRKNEEEQPAPPPPSTSPDSENASSATNKQRRLRQAGLFENLGNVDIDTLTLADKLRQARSMQPARSLAYRSKANLLGLGRIPSKSSKKVLSRLPEGWSRMNPPNSPSLVIIR